MPADARYMVGVLYPSSGRRHVQQLVNDRRKGDSRRFGPLVQRALVGGPAKCSEGLQCLQPDCQVNLSHFEDLLKEIDNTLRSLPATGQVTHCVAAEWVICTLKCSTDLLPLPLYTSLVPSA